MGAADRFNEAQAAQRLGISKATLVRERLVGRIHPIRIGPRVILYTQQILDEYEEKCPEKTPDIMAKAMAGRQKLHREHGVYFLFQGDELQYVGRTGNFTSRLANHMFRKNFDSYTFLPTHESRAAVIEERLIAELKPPLNMTLTGRPTLRRTGHGGS